MQPKTTLIPVTIVALLILSLPSMADAQQRRGGRPGQDLDQTLVELTQELDLSEEQAGQIRELLAAQNEASRKLIEEARSSGQGRSAFGAMRERMASLREETDEKIKAILSAEQMSKYEEFVIERTENRERQRGQRGPPGGQRGS